MSFKIQIFTFISLCLSLPLLPSFSVYPFKRKEKESTLLYVWDGMVIVWCIWWAGLGWGGGQGLLSVPLPHGFDLTLRGMWTAACDCGTEKPVSILGLYCSFHPAWGSVSQPALPPISAGFVLQLWGEELCPSPVSTRQRHTLSLSLLLSCTDLSSSPSLHQSVALGLLPSLELLP